MKVSLKLKSCVPIFIFLWWLQSGLCFLFWMMIDIVCHPWEVGINYWFIDWIRVFFTFIKNRWNVMSLLKHGDNVTWKKKSLDFPSLFLSSIFFFFLNFWPKTKLGMLYSIKVMLLSMARLQVGSSQVLNVQVTLFKFILNMSWIYAYHQTRWFVQVWLNYFSSEFELIHVSYLWCNRK